MKESPHGKLLLGIDIGMGGAKCAFYDCRGNYVAGKGAEYGIITPRPGWAEQNPEDWWQAVTACIRECIGNQGISPADVAAVGVSCTNAVVPVDRDGKAVHNAIVLFDQRTDREVRWIKENLGEERVFRVTGNRVARGTFSLPSMLWLLKNRPEVAEKTWKFLVPSGFVTHKLTGNFSITKSRLSYTLLADVRKGDWDADLARDAGVPLSMLPTPYAATDVVGTVQASAAAATGLLEGTPVIAGAMDTASAAFASGAAKEGAIFLTVGSTVRLCYTTDSDRFDRRFMNTSGVMGPKWLYTGATSGAGASLRWFRDTFGRAMPGLEPGTEPSFEDLSESAAGASPGAGGLLYLPYLVGERSPIWNPEARGVFFGIGLNTAFADFARAIMEGVGFSIRHLAEIILRNASAPPAIALSGGASKSAVWCQIIADIVGHPLIRLELGETETLGAALVAGHGAGLIRDPIGLIDMLVKKGKVYYPDPANKSLYDGMYALFLNVYADTEKDFLLLARSRDEQAP
ncbi:MAG: carbohydrate kinase [Deltaproteobacteria bacterium]|nr:carbohydrate kinase [Deltaproteobacteria bacterium]